MACRAVARDGSKYARFASPGSVHDGTPAGHCPGVNHQRVSAASSSSRAATHAAPSRVSSFFQNGARDLR